MTTMKRELEMAVTEALEAWLEKKVFSWIAVADPDGNWRLEDAECDDGLVRGWGPATPDKIGRLAGDDAIVSALKTLIAYTGTTRESYVWIRPEFEPNPPSVRRTAFRDLLS